MPADVFIRRPVLSSVLALLAVLAGGISIPSLPVERYPQITPPSVTVTAFYTGANAQAVETAVTTPLEQVINGVEGMTYMVSSSTNSGASTITVTFQVGRDPDLAAVDVQNRINQAMARLPVEVRNNGIGVTKNTAGFLMGVGFFSRDNRYDSLFISNYLDRYVRDALKRIPGVGNVTIFGERKYAMRLWLDPEALASHGITAGEVVEALRAQNVQVASGGLGDAPSFPDQMFQMSVRALGRLTDASEFENVVLKADRSGALVRVRDVGRVELGAETYSSRLRFVGLEASGLGIQPLPTANALELDRAVRAELERLSRSFPPGLEYRIAFENTTIVRESIGEVLKTLAVAILLVVLVLFVFLQNWRSTVIPSVTIPVSLVGTFAFVKLFGFSINTLTLFGIVLATGIVVDDAIVVIENIERHMREYGKSAFEASRDALQEVFGAVLVIGLVLVAVFVPVAFFPGTTGRLYRQFSLTIAFAVVLSVFNAVTLTPALSALLLERARPPRGPLFAAFNAIFQAGTSFYLRAVRWTLGHRAILSGAFLAGLAATALVWKALPSAFLPEEDEGYFITVLQAPPGASLEYTSEIARQAERILLAQPEIAGVFAVAGFSFAGSAPNNGLIFSRLKPIRERRGKEHSLRAVLERVRGALFGIPGAWVLPFAPPPIPGFSPFGGFQFEILDQVGGELSNLETVTQDLIREASKTGRVTGLYSPFRANDPQLLVEIDRARARAMGVPIREITDALQVFLGSEYVNDFDFADRSYRVYVQADRAFRSRPGDLSRYHVRSERGEMIPLDALVRVRETTSPQVVTHFNLFRSAEISGSAAPGVSSGQAISTMEQVAREVLPAGYGFAWAGQSLEEIRAGRQAGWIFALSVLVVYLVLAAQYESWVLPFIILLGVPLAAIGALLAQWARGYANDVFCQVGLVLLVGLAAKNSVLIVEFAEQLRGRGLGVAEAAVEAARIRLRPILMTSIALVLGVSPLALASGAGAAARNSVGTTVLGGMISSTFLSVIFIPVLYVTIRTLVPGRVRGHSNVVEEGAHA